MEWYKTLTLHQRINLKSLSKLICGIPFEGLTTLFSLEEAIDILYMKMNDYGLV